MPHPFNPDMPIRRVKIESRTKNQAGCGARAIRLFDVEAETFQTSRPRCGTKAEAKAAERSTRAGFSGSAKPATKIVEAAVHAPFESSFQTCRPCAFSYES